MKEKLCNQEAIRLEKLFKNRVPKELRPHMVPIERGKNLENLIFVFEFDDDLQNNRWEEFNRLAKMIGQLEILIQKSTKFNVTDHGDDEFIDIRVDEAPDELLKLDESTLLDEGFFDKFKKNKQPKEDPAKKTELCLKYKQQLQKERSRLIPMAKRLVDQELKKGAETNLNYDYPEDGMYMVMQFDLYDIIPDFRSNYGEKSHVIYDKVANIASQLNKQVSSNVFKVKIDNDGDWDDPIRVYVCLNMEAAKANMNENAELNEGFSINLRQKRDHIKSNKN